MEHYLANRLHVKTKVGGGEHTCTQMMACQFGADSQGRNQPADPKASSLL
jgi:hypothetical protein